MIGRECFPSRVMSLANVSGSLVQGRHGMELNSLGVLTFKMSIEFIASTEGNSAHIASIASTAHARIICMHVFLLVAAC